MYTESGDKPAQNRKVHFMCFFETIICPNPIKHFKLTFKYLSLLLLVWIKLLNHLLSLKWLLSVDYLLVKHSGLRLTGPQVQKTVRLSLLNLDPGLFNWPFLLVAMGRSAFGSSLATAMPLSLQVFSYLSPAGCALSFFNLFFVAIAVLVWPLAVSWRPLALFRSASLAVDRWSVVVWRLMHVGLGVVCPARGVGERVRVVRRLLDIL